MVLIQGQHRRLGCEGIVSKGLIFKLTVEFRQGLSVSFMLRNALAQLTDMHTSVVGV